jgi:hypothetical protein
MALLKYEDLHIKIIEVKILHEIDGSVLSTYHSCNSAREILAYTSVSEILR